MMDLLNHDNCSTLAGNQEAITTHSAEATDGVRLLLLALEPLTAQRVELWWVDPRSNKSCLWQVGAIKAGQIN